MPVKLVKKMGDKKFKLKTGYKLRGYKSRELLLNRPEQQNLICTIRTGLFFPDLILR